MSEKEISFNSIPEGKLDEVIAEHFVQPERLEPEGVERILTNLASSELIKIELDYLKQGGLETDPLVKFIEKQLGKRGELGGGYGKSSE